MLRTSRTSPPLLMLIVLLSMPQPGAAQRLIERTPNLPNSTTVLPGFLEATLPHRFARAADGSLTTSTTFDVAVGMPFLLPVRWTGGVRFAPTSSVTPGEPDEWEGYTRFGLLRQTTGSVVDLNLTGAYNHAARSIDGEATVARRVGAFRLIGAARAMTEPYGADETRFALAAGAVWHVRPRSMGVTVAADIATLLDRRDGLGGTRQEDPAWSVGVHAGLPYTSLSFGLQASNTATTTIEGASLGGGPTRYGFELNAPVELFGFALGWFAEREAAVNAVTEDPPGTATVRVDIRNFVFAPATIRVRQGQTIEWVNGDDVVHTVDSENAAFQSGAIEPGSSWRARFDDPGMYPYYCGPHPFMKGVIVVTGS